MTVTRKKLRLLAVEDSSDDVELMLNELDEAGFTVVHQRVETAASLKSALKSESWDVVISDHNLPLLDSMTALKIVREVREDVPFIVVSGCISDDVAIQTMRLGARDYVRKNNLSKLVPVIERELQQISIHAELKKVQETLHRAEHFDALTGLPNREHLFEHLQTRMFSDEQSQPFGVFLIDLNRFRQVTKLLGMMAGNKVLAETAIRLRKVFDKNDFVARFGSDTFVAIVENLHQKERADDIARGVHQCMSEAFQIDGQELFIKTGVGVSFYPKDGHMLDDLFRNAESALHSAKAVGGSSYQIYQPEMDSRGKDRLVMEAALYHALEENQFMLHYQPQFDLRTSRITGVEALIRWNHPELGVIPPNEFIPILEETGLIVQVGEWVLRTACNQNKQWQDAGLLPVVIAVNLSVMQFRKPGFAAMVRKILNETGLSSEYLELEITENIAMHAEEAAIDILSELRAIGIHIAIDDFGTGYSSLSYLKQFPIDRLKIDQSFIRDLEGGVNDGGIVKAIIGMGHSLNLNVIAEGVETKSQIDFLLLNNCDAAQGYFFGTPMKNTDCAVMMAVEAATS